MRAGVYHGQRDVRVQAMPEPGPPGVGQVLVGVEAASLCGTDLSEFTHGPVMIPLTRRHRVSGHRGPTILGHEFTGRVLQVGSDVDAALVGQRIVPGAGAWCTQCEWCRVGRINLCANYFIHGIHTHGGLAEYALVPAMMCERVPDGCSSAAAAVAQPLAVALHAIARAELGVEESVVVVGVGGIGAFLVAAACTRQPAQVIAVDPSASRARRALALGATTILDPRQHAVEPTVADLTRGLGAGLVIEASGTNDGLALALRLVAHGGRVLLVGLQTAPSSLDLHHHVRHEINIVTSNGHLCPTDLPAALELLASSGLARHVISDFTVNLDGLPAALLAMADNRTGGKVVVNVGEP